MKRCILSPEEDRITILSVRQLEGKWSLWTRALSSVLTPRMWLGILLACSAESQNLMKKMVTGKIMQRTDVRPESWYIVHLWTDVMFRADSEDHCQSIHFPTFTLGLVFYNFLWLYMWTLHLSFFFKKKIINSLFSSWFLAVWHFL